MYIMHAQEFIHIMNSWDVCIHTAPLYTLVLHPQQSYHILSIHLTLLC